MSSKVFTNERTQNTDLPELLPSTVGKTGQDRAGAEQTLAGWDNGALLQVQFR
jgi:hypothetical protein